MSPEVDNEGKSLFKTRLIPDLSWHSCLVIWKASSLHENFNTQFDNTSRTIHRTINMSGVQQKKPSLCSNDWLTESQCIKINTWNFSLHLTIVYIDEKWYCRLLKLKIIFQGKTFGRICIICDHKIKKKGLFGIKYWSIAQKMWVWNSETCVSSE